MYGSQLENESNALFELSLVHSFLDDTHKHIKCLQQWSMCLLLPYCQVFYSKN